MALFKIFKGNNTAKITNSSATGYITPTDGYAYYDTSSKLFYIDAAYSGTTISRQPINADNATNGIFYGTCTTAQATQAKVATLTNGTGFSLKAGTIVAIKFTYASAVSPMTLNVNNTGAKNLYQYGTTLMSSGTTTTGWPAGAVIPFVYDGTYWFRLYWANTGTVTSITPGNGLLNGTGTSAITTTGTLNLNYGTSASAIGTTSAAGSANTVSRSDHVHSITLATGDNNGQVKIAGTNVSVKGLGSNAYTSTAYAPLASPALTGTPTAPTPAATSNDTTIATTAFVMNAFTANDAMVFKGVINANEDLPTTHKQGWTYRVATAGTYAGKVCEVGDMIVCVTDGTAANNDHWAVIQNNVDGAVYRGTNAFTDANVIVADSTNGKVKSSGKTITNTAPSASSTSATIPSSTAVWAAISGASGYGKTGTVTSVRVQATAPIVSSSNGTATTSLNTTISLAATSANYVIAGPSSGTTTAVPTYRKLVAADIPSLTKSKISDFPTDVSAFINDSGYLTSFTETDPTVPAWAKASSKPSYTASEVGLGNVTNAAQITKSTFTKAYQVMYSTAANTPAVLDANTATTKKFLRMTGTGSAGAAPAWDTVSKSDVGLSNVENTKLSTWVGSTAITTLGTISTGTIPWARLSDIPTSFAPSSHTHTTSLATDSVTPTITLARSTTYKLTAGGTSVIFKTPTDAHVMQSASGANTNYKLLFTTTDSPTSGDSGPVFYNSNITINPSTSTITAANFNGTATKATQDSDGNAINTTYVKKSGDTMTGALIFNSSANNTYPYIKRTDIDSSVTSLSSAKYAMLTGVKDNNNNWIGYIENMISTSGENQLQVAARKSINGSNVNNALALKVAANGTKSAVFESDVLPKTNDALNLGNSSYKWKNIYAGYLSGAFNQTLNLYAKDAINTAKSFVEIYARNYLGNISGQALYSVGSTTNITAGQWQFREYSPNSPASATSTGKYEQYSLPNATSGLSATQYYDILTTKLHFTNKTIATSGWTGNDTTYSGFPYKANITCNGVTADHVPNVIFDYNELISGNFCPFADSSSNTVTIYCKTKPTATITIPTIYCT